MPLPRVLVLGGSAEAFRLAETLVAVGTYEVITSLAGRTADPRIPEGELRVGGFGGIPGLVRYLADAAIAAVVDATHPFTATMPGNAAAACEEAGVPRLRLRRPGWRPEAGDRWTVVGDLALAAAAVEATGADRVFLTTGRQELRPFAPLTDVWFLVRAIDPPVPQPLARAEVILDRGPFGAEAEVRLFEEHRIQLLVTKNSGGPDGKLVAARRLGLPVVMVARPPAPPGPCVSSVPAAVDWLASAL